MIEGGDMMQHKILTEFLFFSIVMMIGFLVNGCNGVPPEMVEEQIQNISLKIQAVSHQSEPLAQAEDYLRQAKDAQLNKQWEQAHLLSEWAELRVNVALAIDSAKNIERQANEVEHLLSDQKRAVKSARTNYENAESDLYLLQKERDQ